MRFSVPRSGRYPRRPVAGPERLRVSPTSALQSGFYMYPEHTPVGRIAMRNVVRSLTIAFFLGGWCTAVAQTPKGLPPPSYGTPSAASGGVLNAYEVRILRDWLLGFSMIVPAAELQTLLPPGYSVQSGSTALLNVSFVFQQR